MAQTISTKYLNATNTNGARIKAMTTSGESLTAAYNYGKEGADAHAEVAQKLKTKLGWKGKMHGGAIKDGYVFVFADGLAINPVPPLKSKSKTINGVAKLLPKSERDGTLNDVVLFLPDIPANRGYIMSWQVVGEHGEASIEFMNDLVLAKTAAEKALVKKVLNIYAKNQADELRNNPRPRTKPKTNPKPRTKLVARSSTNIKRAKAAKPVSRVNKMTGDNGKSYRVSQSNDGKTYYRLADFYEKKNAKVYAESYAKLYPNKYIKIDSI